LSASVEEKRLAIEIIATLVYIKDTMADLILKPAGVPADIYKPIIHKRDEETGKALSKRKFAPLIIEALEERGDSRPIVRAIIKVAADWSDFHLAQDEFAARATVQKAREVHGTIELMQAREAKQRAIARKQELEKMEKERTDFLKRNSELLLMMFNDLTQSTDAQRRGYVLQELLERVFTLHEIPVTKPFTRNNGAEQIDGKFELDGWHYLVECRWRTKLADIRELDGLHGQVGRSGKQAMGLFLSINGWSDNVPSLLKQNSDKSILLMEGYDLRCVLDQQVGLRELLKAKISALNDCEPFYSVVRLLRDRK
jgi:hypothetical protein